MLFNNCEDQKHDIAFVGFAVGRISALGSLQEPECTALVSSSEWKLLTCFRMWKNSLRYNNSIFFSSVAADFALRLGPWFHNFRQIKNNQKPETTATTRKSPGQICVSPAGETQKGAGATTKHPHQKPQDLPWTRREIPPCHCNMHF